MTIGHRDGGEDEGLADDRQVRERAAERRLRTVRVGKTASQIIRASWCLVGGGTARRHGVLRRSWDMVTGRVEVEGRVRTSSSTRSALMAMAAADPSPAAVMTWARGLATLPATQTPGTLVRPVASATTQPSSSMVAAEADEQVACSARTAAARTPRPGGRPARRRARRRSAGRPRRRSRATGPSTTPIARATSCSRCVGGRACRCAGRARRRPTTAGPAARARPPRRCRRARRAAGRAPRSRGSRGSAAGRGPSARGRPGCRGARRAGRWRPARGGRVSDRRRRRAGPRSPGRAQRVELAATRAVDERRRRSRRPRRGRRPAARRGGMPSRDEEALHVRGGGVARLAGVDDRDPCAGPGPGPGLRTGRRRRRRSPPRRTLFMPLSCARRIAAADNNGCCFRETARGMALHGRQRRRSPRRSTRSGRGSSGSARSAASR